MLSPSHPRMEFGLKKHHCTLVKPIVTLGKKKYQGKGYCRLITGKEAGSGTCCLGEFALAPSEGALETAQGGCRDRRALSLAHQLEISHQKALLGQGSHAREVP